MAYDMSEIEKRLQMASAYRKLLDSKFLDASEVNELIEAELKEFIHGKLETILGVRAAENQAVYFSGMEVVALKALARKVMEPREEKAEEPEVGQPLETRPQPKAPKPRKPRTIQKKKEVPIPTDSQSESTNIEPVVTAPVTEELPSNIVVENGRTYEVVDIGGKPFAKDITKQVRSKNSVPMPSKAQFEAMMYTQAMNDLALSNNNPLVAAAVNAVKGD